MFISQKSITTITNQAGQAIELGAQELADLKYELNVTQLPASTESWMIAALIGQKITAIKTLRELRNLGLKEAKDAVEYFVSHVHDHEIQVIDESKKAYKKSLSPNFDQLSRDHEFPDNLNALPDLSDESAF